MYTRRPGATSAAAFTLVELVLSVGITAALTAGLASAVLLSAHALPSRRSESRDALRADSALRQLVEDLSLARTLTIQGGAAAEFEVADRDGDGSADLLHYAWDGPGTALKYQRNGGTAFPLLDDVAEFSMEPITRTVEESTTTSGATSSGETLLASFTGWSGLLATSQSYTLSHRDWGAQAFAVSWPSGASDRVITRARFRLESGTRPTAQIIAKICKPQTVGSTVPGDAIGSPGMVPASTLPGSFQWVDFTFEDVVAPAGHTVLSAVLCGSASGAGVLERYHHALAGYNGTTAMWTTNSGSTWEPSMLSILQYDHPYYIYGTYTLHGSQTAVASRTLVVEVRVALRLNGQSRGLTTRVALVNKPEVTP
ncbi:MAG: hypothetical protein IPM64_13620 [Phycisphaerales bacterium]|nr:hypothetical protein [Phycisphaerales bacterium]